MVLAAINGPIAARDAGLVAARKVIITANRRDAEAVEPLLAYYESFAEADQPPPVGAIDGLQKALEAVPAASATRLALATALASCGQSDAARRVVLPVAVGAYDSPERKPARALITRIAVPLPATATQHCVLR